MSERERIYLWLAHMSEAGFEQKYIKEARRLVQTRIPRPRQRHLRMQRWLFNTTRTRWCPDTVQLKELYA